MWVESEQEVQQVSNLTVYQSLEPIGNLGLHLNTCLFDLICGSFDFTDYRKYIHICWMIQLDKSYKGCLCNGAIAVSVKL